MTNNDQTPLVAIEFDDGTKMYVRATGQPTTGSRQLTSGAFSQALSAKFDNVAAAVKNLAGQFRTALHDAAPSSTELEFGLDLHAESSELFAILAKGELDASLKVTLKWEAEASQ